MTNLYYVFGDKVFEDFIGVFEETLFVFFYFLGTAEDGGMSKAKNKNALYELSLQLFFSNLYREKKFCSQQLLGQKPLPALH